MQKYLIIGVGGALGSIARFWLGSTVSGRLGTRFPYGTFIVNIVACVIIGFSLALLGARTELSPAWRFLIPIGFVGGFSTFSAFEWEIFANLQMGAFFIAALYVALSIILGLFAVWCGVLLARLVT